ncbi:MAG: LL-diaminopimelate aminotransferase [Actinomycetota bacterium]|nr:LL-diaminopimelate aminotransferase [Actinomycetota bacterium]MDA8168033.1 LL-diaminopimelate aminotransferase [Actinomycetota bacterium]
MRFSHRMDGLPPYLFAEIERKVAEKKKAGVDVISLGIGDPDTPTPAHIVEEMQRQIADPANHRYPNNRGLDEFRQAVATFYKSRFGVDLDPETEVFPLLGSKEGIAHICFNFLDAGDVCLGADPGYPVYAGGPVLAGGEPVPLPLRPELGFQPDLASIPDDIVKRAKMLFVNYPNNPTGAVIENDFFEHLVEFGRRNDICIIHDNAYSEITFDGYVAPSFLETPGAKEAGIEFYSLSKTYNMTGWRIGAAVGNAEVIESLWRLKTNVDSGMFQALQRTAAFAMTSTQKPVREMCAIYQRRRDLVVGTLREIGIEVTPPKGTIYIWVPVPDGYTSAGFADMVLEKCAVVVPPGSGYGPSGEGFVRISLTAPEDRIAEALDRIKDNL